MYKIEVRKIFFGKETDIKFLSNYLNCTLNIHTFVEYYLDKCTLKIKNQEFSNNVLIIGSLISKHKKLDIKLIDYLGKIRDLDRYYFCNFFSNLHSAKNEMEREIDEECEMQAFVINLSASLNIDVFYTKDIFGNYELYTFIGNLIGDSINDEKLYNAIKNSKERLIYIHPNSSSFKHFRYNTDGNSTKYFCFPIPSKEENMLASYFNKSLLNNDLFSPKAKNGIGPRATKTAKSKYKTKFLGYRYLENEEKLLNYFEIKYEENHEDGDFLLNDEIAISTKMERLSDLEIALIFNVKVKRKADGKKWSTLPTVFDKLFKSSNYDDCEFSFTIKEYYKIIDFNLLLHYTDATKYYEVFEIPLGFNFENPDEINDEYHLIYNGENTYSNISEVEEQLVNKHRALCS